MKSKTQKRTDHRGLTGSIKASVPRGILSSSLRGLAAALILGLVLLIAISAIVYTTDDPTRFVIPAAFTVLYISFFGGGLIAARSNRGSALLCGGLTSLMLLALLFVASLFVSPSLSADFGIPMSLGLRGIAMVVSLIGAFLGAGEKKSKKKKKQKIKYQFDTNGKESKNALHISF